MTALAMGVTPNLVAAWCDGAECSPERGYVLSKFQTKLTVLQHLPCLMLNAGHSSVHDMLMGSFAGRWFTFDHMVERMPEDFRLAHEVASDILDKPLNAMIWYAGWSHAAGRMTGYRAQIFADKGGAPEIMPLHPFEITPHPEDEVLQAAGFLKDDKLNVTVDDIPAFFELARREKMRSAAQPAGAEGMHIVGGFIQFAGRVPGGGVAERWSSAVAG